MPKYQPMPDHEVPLSKQRQAFEALTIASKELAIKRPRVVWWQESNTGKARPFTYGWVNIHPEIETSEINLVVSTPEAKLKTAVFHEARHVWQAVNVRYYGKNDRTAAEEDAERYAYSKTGNYL